MRQLVFLLLLQTRIVCVASNETTRLPVFLFQSRIVCVVTMITSPPPPPQPLSPFVPTDIHDDPDAAGPSLLGNPRLHRSNDPPHLGHGRHDSPSRRFSKKLDLGGANARNGGILARLRLDRDDLIGGRGTDRVVDKPANQ